MPGIAERRDGRWVNLAWFLSKDRSPLAEFIAAQVDAALQNLIYLPRIETHAERVLAMTADAYPSRIFDFFGDRLKYSTVRNDEEKYEAIPHQFYTLQESFSLISAHAVDTVRTWFVSGDYLFEFTGGRMLSSNFPDFPTALEQKLLSYVHRNVREEIAAEQRKSEEDLEMRKRMCDAPQGDGDKS